MYDTPVIKQGNYKILGILSLKKHVFLDPQLLEYLGGEKVNRLAIMKEGELMDIYVIGHLPDCELGTILRINNDLFIPVVHKGCYQLFAPGSMEELTMNSSEAHSN
ncbi:hypothetical protein PAEPH01_1188 [Pancytospora epiphaga]|nr:hypothetical protein PAEPH01_1188 [Pancytospora epiphaga]